ncbi:MAG: ribonuclease III [Alphaproteobacteria bacterium]|nr:ribonuclease III [Alphaproteobacteria bacterium]
MENLQKTINYHFKNISLLKNALTLAKGNKAARYERLEFLGDRVLGLIVADLLLQHHTKEKEGDIAKRFTALVREETLADLAKSLGIGNALITDVPELRENNSVLADVMEALLAAIYKDSDFETVYKLTAPLFRPLLDKDIKPPTDPKTAIQEWGHKHNIMLPKYTIVSQSGPAHAPVFKVCLQMAGFSDVFGEGTSKKLAEQNAAETFLNTYVKEK